MLFHRLVDLLLHGVEVERSGILHGLRGKHWKSPRVLRGEKGGVAETARMGVLQSQTCLKS